MQTTLVLSKWLLHGLGAGESASTSHSRLAPTSGYIEMHNSFTALALDLIAHASAAKMIIAFEVDPRSLRFRKMPYNAVQQPMLTGHGDASALAKLLLSFHQWEGKVNLVMWSEEGYNEFWLQELG